MLGSTIASAKRYGIPEAHSCPRGPLGSFYLVPFTFCLIVAKCCESITKCCGYIYIYIYIYVYIYIYIWIIHVRHFRWRWFFFICFFLCVSLFGFFVGGNASVFCRRWFCNFAVLQNENRGVQNRRWKNGSNARATKKKTNYYCSQSWPWCLSLGPGPGALRWPSVRLGPLGRGSLWHPWAHRLQYCRTEKKRFRGPFLTYSGHNCPFNPWKNPSIAVPSIAFKKESAGYDPSWIYWSYEF